MAQLSMHSSSASFPSPDCSSLDGLSAGQQRMCRLFDDHMPFVGLGAREALIECQWQFRQRRWNCSTHGNGIMGPVHNKGGSEFSIPPEFGHGRCKDFPLKVVGDRGGGGVLQVHRDQTEAEK